MFISLETRHLAWGSNNIIFIFYFLVGLGLRFFFSRNNLKKVDPHFADRFGQSGRPTQMPEKNMYIPNGLQWFHGLALWHLLKLKPQSQVNVSVLVSMPF